MAKLSRELKLLMVFFPSSLEAGKSPSFSKIISITYNPSHSTPQILIKAHEEDLVSNDILG